MTGAQSSPARNLARQLLAREASDTSDPAVASAAMQRVLTRVSQNLCLFVGDDGYHALLVRALTRVQGEHPALGDLRQGDNGALNTPALVAAIDNYGVPAVNLALESLLTSVVDLLGGLIGVDLVRNLLDHDIPSARAIGDRQRK